MELTVLISGHRIGAAGLGRPGGRENVGHVRSQFDDYRHARVLFAPAGDHFDIFGHLADGRTHAPLRHAVGAAEIEFDAIGLGLLDFFQYLFPGPLLAWHHQRDDDGAVGPVALDLLDLPQIDLQGPVCDQFNIVEADQAPVAGMNGAVAGTVDIDDRRPLLAQCLPDDAAPAGLEGAHHVIFLIGRRRRSEPERIGRFDAEKVVSQVGHDVLPVGWNAVQPSGFSL